MAKLNLWEFIREQWSTVPPVTRADLCEKTVIVIGANTGIGFETCKHFAEMNTGRLIMACRNPEKGEAALKRLFEETGYTKAELWLIDLASFTSVKAFARKFEEEGGRLDILVENAAVVTYQYTPTVDGWEQALQTNTLSPFYLSILLLPRMLKTAEEYGTTPRIVVVSSKVYFYSHLEPDLIKSNHPLKTLGSKEYWTQAVVKHRYYDSKLIGVLLAHALTRRLPSHPTPDPILVTLINPGYCYSELRREFLGWLAVMDWVREKFLAWTPEQGARQVVYGAVGEPDGGDVELQGAFVSLGRIDEHSEFVLSEQGKEARESFWDDFLKVLGDIDPQALEIANDLLK